MNNNLNAIQEPSGDIKSQSTGGTNSAFIPKVREARLQMKWNAGNLSKPIYSIVPVVINQFKMLHFRSESDISFSIFFCNSLDYFDELLILSILIGRINQVILINID